MPLVSVNPEPPAEIVRRLQQVDDRLSLKFGSIRQLDYSNTNESSWWGISLKWAPDDKRRIMIQRGDMPEDGDWDMIAMLPLDCSVEDAYNFFVRGLKSRDQGSISRVVSRVQHWNDDATQENLKPTMELAEELIETNAKTMFKEQGKDVPRVFVRRPKD